MLKNDYGFIICNVFKLTRPLNINYKKHGELNNGASMLQPATHTKLSIGCGKHSKIINHFLKTNK